MIVFSHKKRATRVARSAKRLNISHCDTLQQHFCFCLSPQFQINPSVSRKRKPITKHDYEMLAAFRYCLRQFLRFSEDAAHRSGVTPQQHQVLLAIKGFPGRAFVTVGELAERLQLAHHSTVGLVDRLQKHKFIKRTLNAQDHRKVHVKLTAKGERVLEKLSAEHREQLRRLGPQFDSVLAHLRGTAHDS
jgi:DNA-binding MarR family transcriptional regulator